MLTSRVVVFRRVGGKRDVSDLNGEAIPALRLSLVSEMPVGAPVNKYARVCVCACERRVCGVCVCVNFSSEYLSRLQDACWGTSQ